MSDGEPRDLRRSAHAFGASGGCSAGCKDCRYIRVCGYEEGEPGDGEPVKLSKIKENDR